MAQVNKENIHLGLVDTFWVYVSYVVLLCFGHARDWIDDLMGYKTFVTAKVRLRRLGGHGHSDCALPVSLARHSPLTAFFQGYAPLTNDFEAFYTRRMYTRIEDCWNRPITGLPGAWIDVLERRSLHPVWLRDQVYVSLPSLSQSGISFVHLPHRSSQSGRVSSFPPSNGRFPLLHHHTD